MSLRVIPIYVSIKNSPSQPGLSNFVQNNKKNPIFSNDYGVTLRKWDCLSSRLAQSKLHVGLEDEKLLNPPFDLGSNLNEGRIDDTQFVNFHKDLNSLPSELTHL